MGGRLANAQYQYTLQGDDANEIYDFTPKLVEALARQLAYSPTSVPTSSRAASRPMSQIDRDTASRLGLTASQIDNTLYDAFGQRQVSTIYSAVNQYHVVMEVAPRYWQDPGDPQGYLCQHLGRQSERHGAEQSAVRHGAVERRRGERRRATAGASDSARNASTNSLASVGNSSASAGAAVSTANETMVPLSAFAHFAPGKTPLAVNHQGLFVASTISFNLRARRIAEPGHRRNQQDGDAARHAGLNSRRAAGHGQGLPGFARQSGPVVHRGAAARSISFSACSTRAISIRSRSSRRCRRPASARCSR